jgi:hypothetical protein
MDVSSNNDSGEERSQELVTTVWQFCSIVYECYK